MRRRVRAGQLSLGPGATLRTAARASQCIRRRDGARLCGARHCGDRCAGRARVAGPRAAALGHPASLHQLRHLPPGLSRRRQGQRGYELAAARRGAWCRGARGMPGDRSGARRPRPCDGGRLRSPWPAPTSALRRRVPVRGRRGNAAAAAEPRPGQFQWAGRAQFHGACRDAGVGSVRCGYAHEPRLSLVVDQRGYDAARRPRCRGWVSDAEPGRAARDVGDQFGARGRPVGAGAGRSARRLQSAGRHRHQRRMPAVRRQLSDAVG